MSALDAAEAQLEALRSAISSLESGGAASRDDVLRDLKALRVSVAADSEKVAATAAERDRVAEQVKELTEGNAKLRYQIAQLQRANGDTPAAAPAAAAPAAGPRASQQNTSQHAQRNATRNQKSSTCRACVSWQSTANSNARRRMPPGRRPESRAAWVHGGSTRGWRRWRN